jgi:hypothetical protein
MKKQETVIKNIDEAIGRFKGQIINTDTYEHMALCVKAELHQCAQYDIIDVDKWMKENEIEVKPIKSDPTAVEVVFPTWLADWLIK